MDEGELIAVSLLDVLGEDVVDLDAGERLALADEPLCEYTQTGPYLENPVSGFDLGIADVAVSHTAVCEKILSLALGGYDARLGDESAGLAGIHLSTKR